MATLISRIATSRDSQLTAIKLLHTLVWAVMAGAIVALPVLAFLRLFNVALVLTALVFIEIAVLAMNGGRCPLTDWAEQYTDERPDNFDIYLPNWLARHNKVIFGSLFIVNEAIVAWRWLFKA